MIALELWSALLLAVSSNLDDLGVGFSLGLGKTVRWPVIIVIAVASGLTMAAGLAAGFAVRGWLAVTWASYLSAAVFGGFALWFAWQALHRDEDEGPARPKERIGLSAAFLLGGALGVDSAALGVSAGLAAYPMVPTALFATLSSLLFVWGGSRMGARLAGALGRWSHWGAAGLLFVLGVFTLGTN